MHFPYHRPVRKLAIAVTPFLVCFAAAAGTLEDMDLRSNVEASIRGTAATANLHLKISVKDGVAIPQGAVHDLNQIDDVAMIAAKVRGIERVDPAGLALESAGPSDGELASLATHAIVESPKYAECSIKIAVEGGVVTLSGTIRNASWRSEIRKILGAIGGVVEVVDRLVSPDTPEDRIQKALNAVFALRNAPRFPGHVHAAVKDGVVALDGHVPNLYDKQLAEREAFAINGVRRVDNRLELVSGATIKVIRP